VVVLIGVPVIILVASFFFVGDVVKDVVPVIDDQITLARESAVRDGVGAIEAGVQSWAADHGGRYPAAGRVALGSPGRATVSRYVDGWPSNPFLGGPMRQGTGSGEFTYMRGPGGTSFTITGYGESGQVLVTVP
jgi:hypothetical protein